MTRYQWTITPMGLQGSPASFAQLIDYVIRDLGGVLTYRVSLNLVDFSTKLI